MRKTVALFFVPVALITAAAPAYSVPSIAPAALKSSEVLPGKTVATASDGHQYWVESNFDYQDVATVKPVSSGRPVRRVLVTGYHPVEGFAAEMASRRNAYADADSALEPTGSSRPRGFGPRIMNR